MRILGPLLLLFGNILIFCISFIFVFIAQPLISGDSSLSFISHMLFGIFIAFNINFNYIACAFTDPGSPPPCNDPGKYLGQRCIMVDDVEMYQIRYKLNLAPGVFYIYCRHCKCIKPPRTHHCGVLGKCIYHMDHYCPWMSNCIGYFNYRFFLLFLLYLFIGAIYCVFVAATLLHNSVRRQSTQPPNFNSQTDHILVFIFTVATSGALSVGILLCWHIYLICTNQTTIEFYINMEEKRISRAAGQIYKNPFDMGAARRNLSRIFGSYSRWYYALMPNVSFPIEPQHPFILKSACPTEF